MSPMHSTRGTDSNKLIYFKHGLTTDKFCFQYAAIHDWNLLPTDIPILNNITSFKM